MRKVFKNPYVLLAVGLCVICLVPEIASASGTADADAAAFQGVYNFIHSAATGYLGRAIAIGGGVIGLFLGAAAGKVVPAVMGVMLAVFGSLGPSIINSVFQTAII